MFDINRQLLDKARAVLFDRPNVFWIIGGSCSGKSTVCRAISKATKIPVVDMDDYVYGSFINLYREDRHPASNTYFSAQNPLAWALSLTWADFNSLNRAANAEYLDLLADIFEHTNKRGYRLIDGGITHPAILAQVVPKINVFCIDAPEAERVTTWETSETRSSMKGWIYELPNPDEKWKKFLFFDRVMTQTIVGESIENEIEVFMRDEGTSIRELSGIITQYFGI